MQKKSDLFVVTKAKDLAKYILTVTEKSPKKFRFTLVVRLQNYILDVIENLFLANGTMDMAERLAHQEKASTLLHMLGYFAELASEQQCILFRQYEQISLQQTECLMYLGKWIKDTKRRMQSD